MQSRDLISLPSQAQREVLDFIAFLRERYLPSSPKNEAIKKNLVDEPFIGIWRTRADLEDSRGWVRDTRAQEWSRR